MKIFFKEAGADFIDVNAGFRPGSELQDMLWLIDVIQEAVSVRLSPDSSDPRYLLKAIEKARYFLMLNSTSAEKDRFEQMIPVIQARKCDVVGLCLDEGGIPKNVDQVMENAEKLVQNLVALGVKRERIYLDPIIQAIGTCTRQV